MTVQKDRPSVCRFCWKALPVGSVSHYCPPPAPCKRDQHEASRLASKQDRLRKIAQRPQVPLIKKTREK
jgi:hypothetical protein